MPLFYLMRHADALSYADSPIRSLSEKGIENANKMAEFLKKRQIPVSKILHSSEERSRQTAAMIAKTLVLTHTLELFPLLDPENEVKQVGEILNDLTEHTLLVGHLPNLELLSNFLLTYDYQHPTVSFLPGSIGAYSLQENLCWLQWFIHPGLV